MRLGVVWLLFGALVLTGPAPWTRTAFSPKSPSGGGDSVIGSIRARSERALKAGLPTDSSALLMGMVLGDDSHLSRRVKKEFKRSSLTHVVAASGQNISLLLALALPLMAALGMALRTRLVAGVLLVIGYVPLAGGEAPIRRAAVMALVLVAAQVRGSPSDGWHALGIAGVVTSLLDRGSAASLGWQLSFAAVAGMLSLGRRLTDFLSQRGVPALLSESLAMSVAATAATTPLIAWKVGQVSLVSVPANLVAGPAVAPAMWLGMIAATIGQVSAHLAAPFAWLAALPAATVLEVAHVAGSPSWASVSWRPAGLLAVLMLGVVVASGIVRVPNRGAA